MHSTRAAHAVRLLAISALAFGIAACGSVPQPDAELALARSAISGAEQAGATESVGAILQRAQRSLQQADAAARADNNLQARRLAELAAADAELAESRAGLVRTRDSAREVQQSLETLRAETRRP